MPSILTFGDSNTHGTAPMPTRDHNQRFEAGIRWPTVMTDALGPDWHLAEEGLPGRTTRFEDPVMWPDMTGQSGLRVALASHQPLDVVTIMLGTNDLKTRFNPSVKGIVAGLSSLVDIALGDDIQARHGPFRLILIAPPPVREVGCLAGEFWGAETVAADLAPAIAEMAQVRGVGFFDAGSVISVSPVDGVHFDEAAHRALGVSVAKAVTNSLTDRSL